MLIFFLLSSMSTSGSKEGIEGALDEDDRNEFDYDKYGDEEDEEDEDEEGGFPISLTGVKRVASDRVFASTDEVCL